MKKTLAKLLLDVAKHIITVVVVSSFFSNFDASGIKLYSLAIVVSLVLVWGGVRLNRWADRGRRKKKRKKNRRSKTQKRKE